MNPNIGSEFGKKPMRIRPQRKCDKWWDRVGVVGLWAAAIVGAVAIYISTHDADSQRKVLIDQTKAIQNQLSLTFPPKLIVRQVTIFAKGESERDAPVLERGKKIEGYFWLVNGGREIATIGNQLPCIVYWHVGDLPMYRPYDGDTSSEQKSGLLINCAKPIDGSTNAAIDTGSKIKPGQWIKWRFETVVPASYTKDMSLYILGHVVFMDRLGTYRVLRFARRYDPSQHRFVKIKNDDYEGGDE